LLSNYFEIKTRISNPLESRPGLNKYSVVPSMGIRYVSIWFVFLLLLLLLLLLLRRPLRSPLPLYQFINQVTAIKP